MIRLKHNKYPIWINFEGDADTFNKVKEFIAEDIVTSGFQHYEAFEDIAEDETTVEPTGNDWIEKAERPDMSDVKISNKMTGKVVHDDGTELEFGFAEPDEDDVPMDDDILKNVPNTEGKHTKQPEGGLGKFAEKKKVKRKK